MNQSFFALADQGLFAGANFVVNILLVKWLLPDAYGAFTVAFSIFLLLATVHNGLLIEPMLVFGPKRFKDRIGGYLGGMLVGNAAVAPAISAVLLVVALGAGITGTDDAAHLSTAALGFALVAPLILLMWLMRRACYVRLNPMHAAIAGTIYFIVVTGGLSVAQYLHQLNLPIALSLMALGSVVSAGWLIRKEGANLREAREPGLLREITSVHWQYGRWAALTGIVGFLPAHVIYLLLPMFRDIEEAGALRALTTLVLPFNQACAALCVLLLPRLVSVRGTPAFGRTFRTALLMLTGTPLVAWLLLGVFHEPIVRLLYGGKYLEYSNLLWWIGLQPVLTGWCGVLMAGLEAREQPDRVFYASGLSAVASLVIGVYALRSGSVPAAAVVTIINMVVQAILLGLFMARAGRRAGGSH